MRYLLVFINLHILKQDALSSKVFQSVLHSSMERLTLCSPALRTIAVAVKSDRDHLKATSIPQINQPDKLAVQVYQEPLQKIN